MKLCALCAGLGKDCCHFHDITVTTGDLHRISRFSGIAPEEFVEFRRPSVAAYLDQDDDPNWLAYVTAPDGLRRVLRQASSGSCFFLGAAGCNLPEEIRPLICRLHPVEYTEKGITGISNECPRDHLPSGEDVLASICINIETAERWRRQLYEELRMFPATARPCTEGAARCEEFLQRGL